MQISFVPNGPSRTPVPTMICANIPTNTNLNTSILFVCRKMAVSSRHFSECDGYVSTIFKSCAPKATGPPPGAWGRSLPAHRRCGEDRKPRFITEVSEVRVLFQDILRDYLSSRKYGRPNAAGGWFSRFLLILDTIRTITVTTYGNSLRRSD